MRSAGVFAPEQDPVLDELTRRIVARFHPRQILLFGSRCRGDFRVDSDYDLVVVLDAFEDRRSAAVAIRSALADLPISKDVLVATRNEVDAPRSAILRAAVREARVVYGE